MPWPDHHHCGHRSQRQVRGAARLLIWNLHRIGRRVRLVRAGGGYVGKPGTSAQGGLTSSQRLAEPEHGAAPEVELLDKADLGAP